MATIASGFAQHATARFEESLLPKMINPNPNMEED